MPKCESFNCKYEVTDKKICSYCIYRHKQWMIEQKEEEEQAAKAAQEAQELQQMEDEDHICVGDMTWYYFTTNKINVTSVEEVD